jgi:hypothetical protein
MSDCPSHPCGRQVLTSARDSGVVFSAATARPPAGPRAAGFAHGTSSLAAAEFAHGTSSLAAEFAHGVPTARKQSCVQTTVDALGESPSQVKGAPVYAEGLLFCKGDATGHRNVPIWKVGW